MNLVLIIYVFGSLADYFATAWLMLRGAIEVNPIMAFVLTNWGIRGMLIMKVSAIMGAWVITKLFQRSGEIPHRLIFYTLFFLLALPQWVIVANNAYWIRLILEVCGG